MLSTRNEKKVDNHSIFGGNNNIIENINNDAIITLTMYQIHSNDMFNKNNGEILGSRIILSDVGILINKQFSYSFGFSGKNSVINSVNYWWEALCPQFWAQSKQLELQLSK